MKSLKYQHKAECDVDKRKNESVHAFTKHMSSLRGSPEWLAVSDCFEF